MKNTNVDGDPVINGVCMSHGILSPLPTVGTIHPTQSKCYVGGKQAIVDGDPVSFTCGHSGKCIASTTTTSIQGKAVVVDGDVVVGTNATIIGAITKSTQSKTSMN